MTDFIRANFVGLDVALVDTAQSVTFDVPTQALVGVLAQWCSALGFWMGFSAMTVFELIQLIVALAAQLKSTPKQAERPGNA